MWRCFYCNINCVFPSHLLSFYPLPTRSRNKDSRKALSSMKIPFPACWSGFHLPKVLTGAEEWLGEKKVLEGWKRGGGGKEISPLCNPRALDTQEPKKVGSREGEWLTPRVKTGKENLVLDQGERLPPDENLSMCGVRTAPPPLHTQNRSPHSASYQNSPTYPHS